VRLHDHPRSSNAQKVRFPLGVLGLDYERRMVPVDWLLDAVAMTLPPACRQVGGPAYGRRAVAGEAGVPT
jgi:hypothetical protein